MAPPDVSPDHTKDQPRRDRAARRVRDVPVALGVGLLALAERLGVLLTSPDRTWPHAVAFEGDALLWIDWLRAIRQGGTFELGLAIHSPVVPHVLALLGADPASSDWTPFKLVWCVISALTATLLYLAAARTVGRRIALIASLWFAIAYHASVLAASLNGEALYTLLLVLIVYLGTFAPSNPRRDLALAILLGGLHGLATLTRAEHPLLMLLLIAAAALRPPRSDAPSAAPWPRRLLGAAVIAATAAAVCLPWAISGARAAERLNTTPSRPVEYDRLSPPWTPDARAYMESLPAFVRADNVAYLSALASQRRESAIDAPRIKRYFEEEFGWIPTPLSTRPRVSSQGALCFALANHPDSRGGFSRASLDARFSPDPDLTFALPSHLRLFNDGYAVGLERIRQDPVAWAALVGRKMLRFEAGLTGGLGATNAPIGRSLTRWPVDIAVRPIDPDAWPGRSLQATLRADALWWRVPILLLMLIGIIRLAPDRAGTPWLLILISKLAVAVAFYGYARQAASILPVASVLIGAGLVWTLDALRVPRWAGRVIVSIAVCVVLAIDAREWTRPMLPTIEADSDAVRPARVAADRGAFECLKELRIEYAPPEQPEP